MRKTISTVLGAALMAGLAVPENAIQKLVMSMRNGITNDPFLHGCGGGTHLSYGTKGAGISMATQKRAARKAKNKRSRR